MHIHQINNAIDIEIISVALEWNILSSVNRNLSKMEDKMNVSRKIAKVTVAAAVIVVGGSLLLAQSFEYPSIDRKSEVGKSLIVQERGALQIPSDPLGALSSEDLINAFLDYPFIGLIGAYDDMQHGFDVVCQRFSGARELLTREDIADALLRVYLKADPLRYKETSTPFEGGEAMAKLCYLELLISQDEVLKRLDGDDVNTFLKRALEIYNNKSGHISDYGIHGLMFTGLLIGRVLKLHFPAVSAEFDQIENMDLFLNKVQLASTSILDTIISSALNR